MTERTCKVNPSFDLSFFAGVLLYAGSSARVSWGPTVRCADRSDTPWRSKAVIIDSSKLSTTHPVWIVPQPTCLNEDEEDLRLNNVTSSVMCFRMFFFFFCFHFYKLWVPRHLTVSCQGAGHKGERNGMLRFLFAASARRAYVLQRSFRSLFSFAVPFIHAS